ncbi:uncharacterized protein EAF01_009744 [Botrytis porri]|uniref:uncharacterized protein n=1 Tax=Botrytis porri TaxID=87229 RepID=UPI001900B58E|nr:uncharacterized protein EAF01_009744 [Botrytis porri]KAF7895782.1 hypothetical protein EAF01_009744 [Botrytis porri]
MIDKGSLDVRTKRNGTTRSPSQMSVSTIINKYPPMRSMYAQNGNEKFTLASSIHHLVDRSREPTGPSMWARKYEIISVETGNFRSEEIHIHCDQI